MTRTIDGIDPTLIIKDEMHYWRADGTRVSEIVERLGPPDLYGERWQLDPLRSELLDYYYPLPKGYGSRYARQQARRGTSARRMPHGRPRGCRPAGRGGSR